MHNPKTGAFRRHPFFQRGLNLLAIGFAMAALSHSAARAQMAHPTPGAPRMKTADELIHKQDPPRTTPRVLALIAKDYSNVSVTVSISRQRAYLMVGNEIGIDTPISSGKAGHETPTGKFTVLEKDPDHRSSVYGAFCDDQRRIVRAGVSLHIDSAPAGTHFIGAPMLWFCRFHDAVGMHVGILPGYAASHGCVRLPADIAPLIYKNVILGTPVDVEP